MPFALPSRLRKSGDILSGWNNIISHFFSFLLLLTIISFSILAIVCPSVSLSRLEETGKYFTYQKSCARHKKHVCPQCIIHFYAARWQVGPVSWLFSYGYLLQIYELLLYGEENCLCLLWRNWSCNLAIGELQVRGPITRYIDHLLLCQVCEMVLNTRKMKCTAEDCLKK